MEQDTLVDFLNDCKHDEVLCETRLPLPSQMNPPALLTRSNCGKMMRSEIHGVISGGCSYIWATGRAFDQRVVEAVVKVCGLVGPNHTNCRACVRSDDGLNVMTAEARSTCFEGRQSLQAWLVVDGIRYVCLPVMSSPWPSSR